MAGGGALLLLACVGALPGSARGEPMSALQDAVAVDDAARPVGPVLDVPFLPQTPALCGGAALAMVFRYWGERGVHAETFAHLVTGSGLGIRTGDLVDTARERGWNTTAFAGEAPVVREHIRQGRPVIALIEDRPGRYHYVVLVAWDDQRVVLHDPARGPGRTLTEAAFERVWLPSGRWTLLVLPGDDGPPAVARSRAHHPEDPLAADTAAQPNDAAAADGGVPPACADPLRRAADLAARGDLAGAERALSQASAACPASAAVALELGGLRFLQGRYADAAEAARAVLAAEPDRAYGWELLASSLFLLDDRSGALDAWNRLGRPRTDLVRIDGLRRTRFQVVHDAVAIQPGSIVSNDGLERARRRVAALPTVLRARVDYVPLSGGDAEVHAAIVERPALPTSTADIAAHVLRAAVEARLLLDVALPLAGGEVWSLEWGWQPARRTIALGLAAPGAFGTAWLWELNAAERVHTFHPARDPVAPQPPPPALRREVRRSVGLRASDWASSTLRWQLAAGVDEWADAASYGTAGAALEVHPSGQRVAVRADLDGWFPTTGRNPAFQAAHLRAAARARPGSFAFDWQVGGGLALASPSAPRSIWTGAGSTVDARVPLRAHPLHDREGVVRPDFLAPRLAHATVELRRWFRPRAPFTLAAAVFADAAAAQRPTDTRSSLDLGAGARLNLPGLGGLLRVDLARGTSGGATVLSAGWMSDWPSWW
jgi:hypothetical protein